MQSEVMAVLFYGSMRDSREEIILEEDDPDCFEFMMRYCYCQDLEFVTIEDAIRTYYLADKYIISELKEVCVGFLLGNIRTETVLQIYEMATATDELHLRTNCWMHIAQNTTNVLSSPSFGELSGPVVRRIVREKYLTIASEVEIYKALCTWGKCECERTGREVTGENMRFVLESYLPEVRFLCLSVNEFMAELGDMEILTRDEQLYLLKNLLEPGICDLPKVCSPRKEKREQIAQCSEFLRFERDCERSYSPIGEFAKGQGNTASFRRCMCIRRRVLSLLI